MGCIAVDPIGTARSNHLDRRLVHPSIAHLHRARMSTQQQRLALGVLAIDIESILHRARRMIFRAVQGSEVGPVSFNFRPVSNIESNRSENLFNALPGAHHRMNAADAASAPRQCDVNRFCIQARLHLCIRERIASRIECRFDLFFGGINDSALRLALFRRELAQAFHLLGNLAGLAEISGLCVFECGCIFGSREIVLCLDDKLF